MPLAYLREIVKISRGTQNDARILVKNADEYYQVAGGGSVEVIPVLLGSPTGGFFGMQPCSEPPTQLWGALMLLV